LSNQKFYVWADLYRGFILIVGVIAALTAALVVLPQSVVDRLAANIESSRGVAEYEKIALLYLADEFSDGAFRIRGVIRNIAVAPTARIDAVVRLYGRDRALLETVVVRLDKDIMEPNDFARFELTVPNHTEGFAGYAVEFKLRDGDILPYKDMRRQITQNSNP